MNESINCVIKILWNYGQDIYIYFKKSYWFAIIQRTYAEVRWNTTQIQKLIWQLLMQDKSILIWYKKATLPQKASNSTRAMTLWKLTLIKLCFHSFLWFWLRIEKGQLGIHICCFSASGNCVHKLLVIYMSFFFLSLGYCVANVFFMLILCQTDIYIYIWKYILKLKFHHLKQWLQQDDIKLHEMS